MKQQNKALPSLTTHLISHDSATISILYRISRRKKKTRGTKDHSKQAECVQSCQINKKGIKLRGLDRKRPYQGRHGRMYLCVGRKYLKTLQKRVYKF